MIKSPDVAATGAGWHLSVVYRLARLPLSLCLKWGGGESQKFPFIIMLIKRTFKV